MLGFDFKLASFRPHKKTLGILTRLGTPFALQSSAINISMLFVNALINAYAGVFASAAFGVACKVQQLPDIMSRSLGMATSSMAGQNVGAGMLDRAASTVKIAFVLNAIVWVLFSIVYLIFPEAIFRIFNGEAEVLEFAWTCALMLVISAPAHVFLSPGLSFVQAMGDGKFTLIVAIADAFVARVTLSFIFGILFHMGMSGFVMGFNLATYFTGIPVAIYFFSGHWKNRKLLV